MTSEKYPNTTLEDALKACDESRERVSKMSREERTKYLWAGLAFAYGVKVPFGVNPRRFKKFRRKTRHNDRRNEEHMKEVRKDRQRKGLNPAKKAREYMRSRIPFK
jgi:hypothetical protein